MSDYAFNLKAQTGLNEGAALRETNNTTLPYRNLASAIVMQLIDDYIDDQFNELRHMTLTREDGYKIAVSGEECLKALKGSWIKAISPVDPELIIAALPRLVAQRREENKKKKIEEEKETKRRERRRLEAKHFKGYTAWRKADVINDSLGKRHVFKAIPESKRTSNGCKYIYCEELHRVFPSMRAVGDYLGVSTSCISMCLNGQQKNVRGYHIREIDTPYIPKSEENL